jgi:hypothetical protein
MQITLDSRDANGRLGHNLSIECLRFVMPDAAE